MRLQTPVFPRHKQGFTLVELAIVLVIVALLTSGLLLGVSAQRNAAENVDAQRQLENIRETLIGFALTRGRLPCPALSNLVSGDANAFRLIEAVLDDPAWKDDLPALVQGAMLRQQRGRWLTTVANVWATIALDKFARQFEGEAVSGNTRIALGALPMQNFAWPANDGKAADALDRLLLPWPGRPTPGDTLQLTHEGSGKPWAAMQILAAVPVKEARANGFRVTREVTPVQEKLSGKVTRGDVWRVRLSVESDQEMSWVVLNDPIPAGARILGEGDGRDSRLAGLGEREGAKGVAWPTYVERTFSAYRAYYGYVPRGKFYIDYTLRLNNAGEFSLPATRVEAMYAPEVFGEAPNAKVVVGE